MATPICTLCGELPASQMVTNLDTGESLAICQEDFPTFILGLAEKMMEAGLLDLGVDEDGPAGGAGGGAPGGDDSEGEALTASQIAQDAPEASTPTSGPANTKRTSARTRAASGPSPAASPEAPTAIVAPEGDETADSADVAATN